MSFANIMGSDARLLTQKSNRVGCALENAVSGQSSRTMIAKTGSVACR